MVHCCASPPAVFSAALGSSKVPTTTATRRGSGLASAGDCSSDVRADLMEYEFGAVAPAARQDAPATIRKATSFERVGEFWRG